MYAAVAGLRAHMSALNVIGHNISNVNTLGYKAARYTFSEALYTTSRSGSNGSTTTGGTNPAQYGYGASLGTIDLDMSTKNYTPTGFGLDTMINGDGFFIIGDKNQTISDSDDLQGAKLTRLGNLDFHDGYLVDGDGNCIMGYACTGKGEDGEYTYSKVLTPLRFCLLKSSKGEEEDDDGNKVNVTKYDVVYPEQAEDGTLTYGDEKTDDTTGGGTATDGLDTKMPTLSSISIDEKTGRISGITDKGSQLMIIGYIAIGKVDNPNGVTHVDGRIYQALDGAGVLHATAMGGAEKIIDPTDGTDTGDENDEGGLTIASAGTTGLVTGGLESSGTDLANEISNMIVVQRGYQANTRIVTVTDSMLEELVNMKR